MTRYNLTSLTVLVLTFMWLVLWLVYNSFFSDA